LIAGSIYTAASYLAAVHDSHGDWLNRGALPGAGENLIATLIMGYGGKVLGGILSSTSAEEVNNAFKLSKGVWDMPYLNTNIGENSKVVPDYVSTAHELLNNAFWSAAGCYGSFSWPCTSS
jgi:hypothetical protein